MGRAVDELSLLWTYEDGAQCPPCPSWDVGSNESAECTLEGRTPLPPLLLGPCLEDQNYLENDIIVCDFNAMPVLLRIINPRMPISTSFAKQMYSSLFMTTSMGHIWFLFFGCHRAWIVLPASLGWLERYIFCSWEITELSEYFPMPAILMSAKAEVRF